MPLTSVEAIVNALATVQSRYLVTGGLVVHAHRYLRFTKDIDLVIELHEWNPPPMGGGEGDAGIPAVE
ncbi:MAG: hypothetical protein JJT85_07130 [Chromatiales bacterium]|nr:hypothetical protein [Chromatiales bacterium]